MHKPAIVPEARSAPKAVTERQPHPLVGATFVIAAATPQQLPEPGPPEIAFAGRSNAGKSSAINALAARNRLAFASRTPGRTQQIVFFRLAQACATCLRASAAPAAAWPRSLTAHALR